MDTNLTLIHNVTELEWNVKICLAALVPQWCRSFLIVLLTIFFLTGIPGNALVLIVQAKTRRKSLTDWLVTCLAVVDLISLFVCVPIYFLLFAQWWPDIGSTFGCRFHSFVLHFTFTASVIIISCIAVDRLWKTKSTEWLTAPEKTYFIGMTGFGVSLIIGTMGGFATRNNLLGQCILDPSKKGLHVAVYLTLLALNAISCIIIFFSYMRIVMILRFKMRVNQVPNTTTSQNRERVTTSRSMDSYRKAVRTTKLMFLLTVVFVVSTIFPSIAALGLTAYDLRTGVKTRIVMFFLIRLYLINNCLNPYIYFRLNNAFRKRAIAILKDVRLMCLY